MKLGLIGYPLGQSWSPLIHQYFTGEQYERIALKEDELDDYFKRKEFDGINVTIPYKETVLRYLDQLDDTAREIGAVNCIVKREGQLIGYNTDAIGFLEMVQHSTMQVSQKKVAILGSGGASKAVLYALRKLEAIPMIVSRTKKENAITYEELYEREKEFSFIVNTTPLGMRDLREEVPVDLNLFTNLEGVIDIVANPIRTKLLQQAQEKGIQTLGGYEMLVRQAAYADEIFTGKALLCSIEQCMKLVQTKMRNIVLIGMPTCGKTYVGKALSESFQMPWLDMDEELEKRLGMTITECFETKGEEYFRKEESILVQESASYSGTVISCGGGVIKDHRNMELLRGNGVIIWVNRSLDKLFESEERPLAQTKQAIHKLYEERKELYLQYSDIVVENDGNIEEVVRVIEEKLQEIVL